MVEFGGAGHGALAGAGGLVRPPYVASVCGPLFVGNKVPDHTEREVIVARAPGGLHGAKGPEEAVLAEVPDVAHVAVLHGPPSRAPGPGAHRRPYGDPPMHARARPCP